MRTSMILILFSSLLSLASCEKIGLEENANDITYVYFTRDATADTTAISFKTYSSDTISIPVFLSIAGQWPEQALPFRLSADPALSTYREDKVLLEESYRLSPGQAQDTVYIRLVRYPELQEQTHLLVLKIDPRENIQEGPLVNQRGLFAITDRIFRPDWWTVLDGGYNGALVYNIAQEYYLGKYSEKKYLMFLEELAKDGVQFDGKDRMTLRIYSLRLKYRVQEYNTAHPGAPMMDEENNEEMTIPVAG